MSGLASAEVGRDGQIETPMSPMAGEGSMCESFNTYPGVRPFYLRSLDAG